MAQTPVQITDKSTQTNTQSSPTSSSGGTQTLSPNAPRQITGPGEMVTIQPSRIAANGPGSISAPRVASAASASAVKLGTGEFVDKAIFNTLDKTQQAFLKKHGVDAFNAEGNKIEAMVAQAEKEADEYVQRETAKQEKWESENLVKLDNGETILKDAYDALPASQQAQLKKMGIDKYNEWIKAEAAKAEEAAKVQQAQATPLAAPGQPADTVRLVNGDLVNKSEYDKMAPAQQQELMRRGVDGYNEYVQTQQQKQQQATSTLNDYARSQYSSGFIGPIMVSGEAILEYLAEHGNSSEAQELVKNAGYDITTKDAETGKSITDISNEIVKARATGTAEISRIIASDAKAVDSRLTALISAMENAGLYDNTKLNASLKPIGLGGPVSWVDNTTNRVLSDKDIAERIWNTLTAKERAQVVDHYNADVYKTNYFAEYIKGMSDVANKTGIVGQLVYGPILAIGSPIAKATVNQPVSGTEWAIAGATAVVTAATFGALPGAGTIPGLIARGVTTAAAGTLTGIGIQQTVKNWGEMKTPERVAAVALDVVGLVGTALAGASTLQSAKSVINTQLTTRAAVKAGNAYNNMIRTLDSANAEAAQKGLVSAQTATRVQNSIAASRAADTQFLQRFSNMDHMNAKIMGKFEKLSGYRGLSQAMQELHDAKARLNAAWDMVAKQKTPTDTVKALTDAQVARDNFYKALDKVGDITTPRSKPVQSPVWDDIIAATKDDLAGIQAEIRAEQRVLERQVVKDTTRLNELRENARVLQSNLDQYQALKASGEWRGAPTEYTTLVDAVNQAKDTVYRWQSAVDNPQALSPRQLAEATKRLTDARYDLDRAKRALEMYQKTLAAKEEQLFAKPQDFGAEFNDFMNKRGKYSPEFQAKQRLADEANARIERSFYDKNGFWPGGQPRYGSNVGYKGPSTEGGGGGVATAERVTTQQAAPTETQSTFNMLFEDVVNKPTATEPRLSVPTITKPVAQIPGIGSQLIPAPLLAITPVGLASTVYAASFIADLTPEQFVALFGEDVKVQPVSTVALPRIIASVDGMEATKIKGTEWVSPEEAIRIANVTEVSTYTEQILRNANQAVNQLMIATDNEEALKTVLENTLKTYLQTVTNPALRAAIETELLNATNIKLSIQPDVTVKAQTATQTQTRTATKVQVRPVTRTEVVPRTITPRPITPIVPIRPFIPPFPGASGVKKETGEVYPAGTVAWKMGFVWKIIPPPYNVKKPISSRTPPNGVTVTEGTPQDTLTFIGGVVPFSDISFDLGVTDGYIDVKHQKIIFTGDGLITDVGRRIAGPTTGVSITAIPEHRARALEAEQRAALGIPVSKKAILKKAARDPAALKTYVQSGG